MLHAHFRPMNLWTGTRTKSRKEAQFKAGWLKTLDLLEYELGKLNAKDVVIQIEDPGGIDGIRNDGSIRILSSKYWPDKSGVILTFESPKGNISMPCDRYDFWQDNLRAIALSLQALRAVDRYGVTHGNEQYRGWAQLEAPAASMSREKALEFLSTLGGYRVDALETAPGLIEAAVKRLRREYHPDQAGEDENARHHRHEIFVRLGQAEEVLCG